MDLRDDVLKDRSIRFEQPEPPYRIVAVGCAPTLFVDSGSDHHHGRASQVRIVALAHRNRRRQDRAVLNIRHHTPGPLAVAVDQHDLAHAPPHNQRQEARRTDRARSNNPTLISFLLFHLSQSCWRLSQHRIHEHLPSRDNYVTTTRATATPTVSLLLPPARASSTRDVHAAHGLSDRGEE